jgi:hypothetical protein
MALVPLREAVYAALAQALKDAFPRVRVERNHPDPASSEEPVLLNALDGRHTGVETEVSGEVNYTFEWLVEGMVRMPADEGDRNPGAAINKLAADSSAAIVRADENNDVLPLLIAHAEGTLELYPEEPDMDLSLFGVDESERRIASFLHSYAVVVRWPRGKHFIDLV